MTHKRSARVALRVEAALYNPATNTVTIEYTVARPIPDLSAETSTKRLPSTPKTDQIWLHKKTGRLAVIRSVRTGRVTYRYRTPTGNTRGRYKTSPRTTTTSARKDAFLKSFDFYSDKQGLGLV